MSLVVTLVVPLVEPVATLLVLHGETDVEVRVRPSLRLLIGLIGVGQPQRLVTLVVEVEPEVRVAVLEVGVPHEAALEAVVHEVVLVVQPPAALGPAEGEAPVVPLLLVHVVPLAEGAEVVVALVVLGAVVASRTVVLPQEPELGP